MAVTFERATHASSFDHRTPYNDRLPPWERHNRNNVVQVPFRGRSISPLPPTEHHTETLSIASRTPKRDLNEHYFNDHQLSEENDAFKQYANGIPAAPMTAPPRATTQSPYDSVKIPQAPNTAPHVPAFVKNPANASESLGVYGGLYQPPYQRDTAPVAAVPVPAFPGTMAARQQETFRHRSNSAKTRNEDKPNGFKRFLNSFKNAFKRDPIDEGDFERIEDRHWSE